MIYKDAISFITITSFEIIKIHVMGYGFHRNP